jgi:hypothetical protein
MAGELTVKKNYGEEWTATVTEHGVRLMRSSVGVSGQPYTIRETFSWSEWERFTAWVTFARADLRAKK